MTDPEESIRALYDRLIAGLLRRMAVDCDGGRFINPDDIAALERLTPLRNTLPATDP